MGTTFALFMLMFFMTQTDEITVIDVWFWEFILIGFICCNAFCKAVESRRFSISA